MNPKAKVIVKDLFQLRYEDISENDVVIDAFAAWTPETLNLHQTSLQHLCDILSQKPNRLLVVGGAGSLYTNSTHQTRLADSPEFPEMFKPLAMSMGKALENLKKRDDCVWTYLSPSADFSFDRKKTGKYRSGGEELMVNQSGESVISYADYAIAMIDEAEQGNHIQKRYTVVEE